GILAGSNPFVFTTANPLPTFIIQMLIIILMCRLIKFILSPLKQPSVIAEIIGGIILGPTAMGKIPGFKDAIFPKDSLPFINLVSNFGLVLFLFLVGLELDPRMLKESIRKSFVISLAGMAVPFGCGAAVSYALYNITEPETKTASFGVYLLFLGVAMAITAFPVLARILTELDLLTTPVGSITISAAAVDDATSWCLLALVISLINAGSGLTALYVFLLGVAYTLILIFAIRPLFIKLCVRTGAFENGPSQFIVFITLTLVFVSAFITDTIGIHAIFGGFIAGVIMPHEGGFARHITEKLEDLITVIFLPLYFTLSGLRTQIDTLDDGVAWGLVVLVIFTACVGKITGCLLAARLSKLQWRESLAVGVLMNCKGLVELIVLNLGLDAKLISPKTFAIMVIMALVTTFLTVPLISFIYPPSFYKQNGATIESGEEFSGETQDSGISNRILVCLNKLEHVPAIMTIVQLFQGSQSNSVTSKAGTEKTEASTLEVTALRLIELSDRNSSVMLHSESAITMRMDPVVNVFKAFGQLTSVGVNAFLRVVKPDDFANTIHRVAKEESSGLIILPWNGSGTIIDNTSDTPLEKLFNNQVKESMHTSSNHASFVRDVFRLSNCKVGVLVDRGLGVSTNEIARKESTHSFRRPIVEENTHVYLPFFGGKDDRAALELLVSFVEHSKVKLTVARYVNAD
ncbi:hypothetical protein K502DRAFT_276560, partial [Neoconidiobolus thromboides FSU 785]